MKVIRAASLSTALLMLPIAAGVARAAVFPDVPDGHIYQEPIENLVQTQVINGNPDGTFAPDRTVNRAEMLKMLYKAKGRVPDPLSIRCFADVVIGSWYESFVCDAAARRYVNGYADGTFRPGDPVNRVEALKMIAEVFEIPIEETTVETREVVNFVDVSVAAWYTKYLYAAFEKGILPVAGQEGSRYYPDWPLLRGEAAAYIFNALHVDLAETRRQVMQRSSAPAMHSSSEDGVEQGQQQQQTSRAPDFIAVSFPFEHSGKFDAKRAFSYQFDIAQSATVDIAVDLQLGQPGGVTCRLYRLGQSGFSDEYFLGYEERGSCYLFAALNPGSYQLQLQPTSENTTYDVVAKAGKGDGNDGFREAKLLTMNVVHTETLSSNDIVDWFRFSLSSNQRMTVEVTNTPSVGCIVYAMNDVDLASFAGPQCNHSFEYTPGTYHVAVSRKTTRASQQTYTVRLDKK